MRKSRVTLSSPQRSLGHDVPHALQRQLLDAGIGVLRAHHIQLELLLERLVLLRLQRHQKSEPSAVRATKRRIGWGMGGRVVGQLTKSSSFLTSFFFPFPLACCCDGGGAGSDGEAALVSSRGGMAAR
jgi:hypothetical protein